MLNIQSVFEMRVCYTEPRMCVNESELLISRVLLFTCTGSSERCPQVGVSVFHQVLQQSHSVPPPQSGVWGWLPRQHNTVLYGMPILMRTCVLHVFVVCYAPITTNISGVFNLPNKSYCIIFRYAYFLNAKHDQTLRINLSHTIYYSPTVVWLIV